MSLRQKIGNEQISKKYREKIRGKVKINREKVKKNREKVNLPSNEFQNVQLMEVQSVKGKEGWDKQPDQKHRMIGCEQIDMMKEILYSWDENLIFHCFLPPTKNEWLSIEIINNNNNKY